MAAYRSEAPPSKAELQVLIDGEGAPRGPRAGEGWEAFVRRMAPPQPGIFHLGDRRAHQAAIACALAHGERRVEARALIFPMWLGLNEDEVPQDDVWRRVLVAAIDGELSSDVDLPDGDAFWARVDLTLHHGAFVAPGRHFAPGIDVERFGPFAVLRTLFRSVVDHVVACDRAPATSCPTTEVPPWSCLAEPALDLGRVPADLRAEIEAVVRALSYVNEVEDDDADAP